MSREHIHTQQKLVNELARQLEQAKEDLDNATRAEAVANPEGWLVLVDEYPYSSRQRVKIFPLTTAGPYAPPEFQPGVGDITAVGIEPNGNALIVGQNYDDEQVKFELGSGDDAHLYGAFAFFTTDRKAAEAWQRAEAEKIKNEHQDVTVLLLEEGIES
jgi:hypothetical protein